MPVLLSFVLRRSGNSMRKCTHILANLVFVALWVQCSAEILTDGYWTVYRDLFYIFHISEEAFYEVTSADGSETCFPLGLLSADVICHVGFLSEWVLSQKQCFLVIRTAVRLP